MGLMQRIERLGAGYRRMKAAFSGQQLVSGMMLTSTGLPRRGSEQWSAAYNNLPWLRAAVSKIAQATASLDWTVQRTMDPSGRTEKRVDIQRGSTEYRRKAIYKLATEGKVQTIADHPILNLLSNPCPMFVGPIARQLSQIYYELHGECFQAIERTRPMGVGSAIGRGLPHALWPIPPHWVRELPREGAPYFRVEYGAIRMQVDIGDMLWLKNPDPVNPYVRGAGVAQSLADELDADESAAKTMAYIFYNRGRADVLINLPGWQEQEVRAFKDQWLSEVRGVQNAGKPHFTNAEGMTAQTLSQTFEHLQLTDLRKFSRDMIRQCFAIPPEILGVVDNSNRATIDAAETIFGKHVIMPRAEVWREFYQRNLMIEYDDRAVLDYATPLQEDKNFALSVARSAMFAVKVDDWRTMMGLDPLGEAAGGNLFVAPATYKAVKDLSELTGPPAPGQPGAAPAPPPKGIGTPSAGGDGHPPGIGKPNHDAGALPAGPPGLGAPKMLPEGAQASHPTGVRPTTNPVPPQFQKRSASADFAASMEHPDVAKAYALFAKEMGYNVPWSVLRSKAPFPVSDDLGVETVRRVIAMLEGRPISKWEPMLGEWTKADDELLDHYTATTVRKFDPSQPRDDAGRWTDTGGTGASAKPDGVTNADHAAKVNDYAEAKAREGKIPSGARYEGKLAALAPTEVAIWAEPSRPPSEGQEYDPHTREDRDGDGVTDFARVGVPAHEVPPPPQTIPRLPNLTAQERAVEDGFAKAFEKDPDAVAKEFREAVMRGDWKIKPGTFGTDDAKNLSQVWNPPAGTKTDEEVKDARAQYNTILHQTANAIAKRAFVQQLDEIAKLPEDQRKVLVTSGGCGAGKGYALKMVDTTKGLAASVAAVWDSAGDQNATENPWIQDECEKRGIHAIYAYVHADPFKSWADEKRGVVFRANQEGRMVDAAVFTDSYVLGARNFKAFADRNASNPYASFVYLDNRGAPALLDKMPAEALSLHRADLFDFAKSTVYDREAKLKRSVVRGSLLGFRIWGRKWKLGKSATVRRAS